MDAPWSVAMLERLEALVQWLLRRPSTPADISALRSALAQQQRALDGEARPWEAGLMPAAGPLGLCAG